MDISAIEIGSKGEEAAVAWLRERGYYIVHIATESPRRSRLIQVEKHAAPLVLYCGASHELLSKKL